MRDARDKAAIEAELASLKAQLESSRIFTASLQQVIHTRSSTEYCIASNRIPTHIFNSLLSEIQRLKGGAEVAAPLALASKAENDALKEKLAAAELQCKTSEDAASAASASLNAQLLAAIAERDSLRSQHASELERSHDEIKSLRSQLQDSQHTSFAAHAKFEAATLALEASTRDCTDLRAAAARLDAERIESANSSQKNSVQSLSDTLVAAVSQSSTTLMEALCQRHRELESQNAALSASLSDLQRTIDLSSNARKPFESKIDELESQMSEIRHALASRLSAETTVAAAATHSGHCSDELSEARSRVETLTSDIASLNSANAALASQNAELAAERDHLRSQLAALTREHDMSAQKSELAIAQLQSENAVFKKEFGQFASQLDLRLLAFADTSHALQAAISSAAAAPSQQNQSIESFLANVLPASIEKCFSESIQRHTDALPSLKTVAADECQTSAWSETPTGVDAPPLSAAHASTPRAAHSATSSRVRLDCASDEHSRASAPAALLSPGASSASASLSSPGDEIDAALLGIKLPPPPSSFVATPLPAPRPQSDSLSNKADAFFTGLFAKAASPIPGKAAESTAPPQPSEASAPASGNGFFKKLFSMDQ